MMAPGCRLNSRSSGGRLRQSVRSGRSWRTLRSRELRPAAEVAGRRRSGHRSGHVDKTGTETGHMAGTSAGCQSVFAASVLVARQNGPTRNPLSLPVNPSPASRNSHNREVL